VNKSLAYNPDSFYANWVKGFILFAKTKDLGQTKAILQRELAKDTTNLLMQEELGKVCYMMKDYKGAHHYYKHFINLREKRELDIFKHENLKVAFVLSKIGDHENAEKFAESYRQYAERDGSIYRNLQLAAYYAYRNDANKAIEYMKLFTKEDNFQYWVLLMDEDPATENIRSHPEFKKVMKLIQDKFWANHNKLKITLEEKGVL
jgi:tetratricopeptide (TPR) repeat protein